MTVASGAESIRHVHRICHFGRRFLVTGMKSRLRQVKVAHRQPTNQVTPPNVREELLLDKPLGSRSEIH